MSNFASNPLVLNGLIFVSCYGIAIGHHMLTRNKSHVDAASHTKAGVVAGVVNPATIDALRDFSIHIVIYSGLLIPRH